MKYFQPLTISDDCFDKERIYKEVEKEFNPNLICMWKRWGERTDLLTAGFHNLLDSAGCHIFFAEVFYTPPKSNMIWHIDTQEPSNFIKINFVWGSSDHEMQWGSLKSVRRMPAKLTQSGTKFLDFKDYEINIAESVNIKTPTIVNIGVPHRVINRDVTGRWCLSVNIHDSTGNRIPIDRATELFSEYTLG